MISHLAYVHPSAKIGSDVTIEPFAYIGANVEIGDQTWIGPNATVMEGAYIGKKCKIFPSAVIGAIPQDLKYAGEPSTLIIEDEVTIRECCTLNRGTAASMTTRVGRGTLLMAYVHIAHDTFVGKNCILANGVNLAGHITIDDFAILGGLTAVHQFVRIGAHSMIGGGSLVRKDVPPYVKAAREPLSYEGINSIGLQRRGFVPDDIAHIQDIYRVLFVQNTNISTALDIVKNKIHDSKYKDQIIEFINTSERGLMKGYKSH